MGEGTCFISDISDRISECCSIARSCENCRSTRAREPPPPPTRAHRLSVWLRRRWSSRGAPRTDAVTPIAPRRRPEDGRAARVRPADPRRASAADGPARPAISAARPATRAPAAAPARPGCGTSPSSSPASPRSAPRPDRPRGAPPAPSCARARREVGCGSVVPIKAS